MSSIDQFVTSHAPWECHCPSSSLASLDLVRGFVAVGRRMSITHAADDLCLTQSAVSRQIAALEAHLGVRLFTRGYRAIAFTPEGERLFRSADGAVQQLQDVMGELRAGGEATPVVLSASIGVTGLWLLPAPEPLPGRAPGHRPAGVGQRPRSRPAPRRHRPGDPLRARFAGARRRPAPVRRDRGRRRPSVVRDERAADPRHARQAHPAGLRRSARAPAPRLAAVVVLAAAARLERRETARGAAASTSTTRSSTPPSPARASRSAACHCCSPCSTKAGWSSSTTPASRPTTPTG